MQPGVFVVRKAVLILVSSIVLLGVGASICLPGICGCATSMPGVDGEKYMALGVALDGIGLLGIVSSVAAMPIIHLSRLKRTMRSQSN
jgi:hypothetical protein